MWTKSLFTVHLVSSNHLLLYNKYIHMLEILLDNAYYCIN